MRWSKVLLATLLSCAVAMPHPSLAQSMGAPPPGMTADKEKKKKADPLLSGALAPIPMDAETKAALARSKKPGVLLADNFKKDFISLIRIEGAKKIDPDAMISQLKTHINHEFNKDLIKEDIRRLYAVGIFSEIVVDKNVGPNDSVELTYKLKEKPTLFKVKFEGNDAISSDDLKGAQDLERFHVADNVRIKENADKIRKFYADKGYFLATVRYRLEPTREEELNEREETSLHPDEENKTRISAPRVYAPDFTNVVYIIDEGTKVKIENITFSGNENYSTEELKYVIFSRENHPFGAMTSWGTFNEEMSEADSAVLEQFYQDRGYLNVSVGKAKVSISEDKTRFSIHIPIREGEKYYVGDLGVKGDFVVDEIDESIDPDDEDSLPQFKRDDLLARISLDTGDVFNRTQLSRDVLGIAESYRDQGYAYVNISPETKFDEERKTVDFILNVDAGPRVEIERIDISGNFKTASEVVRRELRVYEGERYSSSMLRLSEIRLNQLGYFEKVKINTKEGTEQGKMVVEVEVEERKTGSFSVGGGYGTSGEGLLFQSQIMQNNLFGRGQSLIGTVQWSGYRRIFDLRFVDPYLTYVGDEPLTFSLSGYNTQRYLGDFTRKSSGGDVTFGYPVGHPLFGFSRSWMRAANPTLLPFVPDFENLRLYLSYGVERVEISDVASGIALFGLHPLQPRYSTSLRPTLQLDQRNDRMFPSAGYFLELRAEFTSFALGSGLLASAENGIAARLRNEGIRGGLWYLTPDAASNNFFRFGANTRFYYNFDAWFPLSGWVLRLNLDLGVLNSYNEQLVSENFRMGGVGVGNVTGLRGYAFQSVGPILPVGRDRERLPTYQFVLGGNKQALMNLELEIPIIKSMRLSGVLFFDMGNVYGPNENFFYAGNSRQPYYTSNFHDPLGTFYNLGLYSSVGFGIRWFSPMAPIRLEFGFPLVRRPAGTPGLPLGDQGMQLEFNIGQSF